MTLAEAEEGPDPFYSEHYFGRGPDDQVAWRRIDGQWAAAAAAFALQLDSETNNTSLALAFELPHDRGVLLFPGDAQVGNWESWHTTPDGKTRTWAVGGGSVTAEQLLNRTVLYKVGHHGSHNATLRERGLEMMTDDRLMALVPVDVHIAHDKKRWTKMPFNPLMTPLTERARGRVIQADVPVAIRPVTPPARVGVADAKDKSVTVEGPDGATVTRPLYVDITLLAAGP